MRSVAVLAWIVQVTSNIFNIDHRSRSFSIPTWISSVGKVIRNDFSFCTATIIDQRFALTAAGCILQNNTLRSNAILPLTLQVWNQSISIKKYHMQRDFYPTVQINQYVLLELAQVPKEFVALHLPGDPECPLSSLQGIPVVKSLVDGHVGNIPISCAQYAIPNFNTSLAFQSSCMLNVTTWMDAAHSCDTSVHGSIGAPLVALNNCLVALHLTGIGEKKATNGSGEYVITRPIGPETTNVALMMDGVASHLEHLNKPQGIAQHTALIYGCIGIVCAFIVAMGGLMIRKRIIHVRVKETVLETPPLGITTDSSIPMEG